MSTRRGRPRTAIATVGVALLVTGVARTNRSNGLGLPVGQ